MSNSEIASFGHIDPPIQLQEDRRIKALHRLGLLEAIPFPVFDEVTQMVSRFLEVPICILSVFDQTVERFQAALGLSRLGLMNPLASSRQLPRGQSLSAYVLARQQIVQIDDLSAHPALSQHYLVERYGIRSYLGIPLFDADGICLGSLAVMDVVPHAFTSKDVEFLELEARWSMGEIERHWLSQQLKTTAKADLRAAATVVADSSPVSAIALTSMQMAHATRVELIAQLTQELRTPLTSIMGMTSVLIRKIYGALTDKQEEYLEVMHESSQCLLSLVDEITELGHLDAQDFNLNLAPVDIEMVCQQAIKTLSQFAQRQDQVIQLTVEPGPRIWVLDKDKVRQILYHLTFSVIHCASAESTIRIHISRKNHRLNIAVWISNPWLSGNFSSLELNPGLATISHHLTTAVLTEGDAAIAVPLAAAEGSDYGDDAASPAKDRRDRLALMLSRELARLHGGDILVQGSAETGVRYVISIPAQATVEESLPATSVTPN